MGLDLNGKLRPSLRAAIIKHLEGGEEEFEAIAAEGRKGSRGPVRKLAKAIGGYILHELAARQAHLNQLRKHLTYVREMLEKEDGMESITLAVKAAEQALIEYLARQ